MQCESRNLNFYKISLTKPKIAVAFHAASAYMAPIGIADERWKHLSLAIAAIAFCF